MLHRGTETVTEKMGQLFSYSKTERTLLEDVGVTVEASFGWLGLSYLSSDPDLTEDARAMYARAAEACGPYKKVKS